MLVDEKALMVLLFLVHSLALGQVRAELGVVIHLVLGIYGFVFLIGERLAAGLALLVLLQKLGYFFVGHWR